MGCNGGKKKSREYIACTRVVTKVEMKRGTGGKPSQTPHQAGAREKKKGERKGETLPVILARSKQKRSLRYVW